jgi:hypothetical protein
MAAGLVALVVVATNFVDHTGRLDDAHLAKWKSYLALRISSSKTHRAAPSDDARKILGSSKTHRAAPSDDARKIFEELKRESFGTRSEHTERTVAALDRARFAVDRLCDDARRRVGRAARR